jgi:hypothetical protein
VHKVGRPSKNGRESIGVLNRITLALYAYGRAREAGEKHIVAITEAVEYIRVTAPLMRISETGVRRIVADWRPRGATKCLLVSKPDLEEKTILAPVEKNGVVSFYNCRVLYTVAQGPRPIYARANAISEPK